MGINQGDDRLGDDEDDLDDAERARLHASLARSVKDINAGRVRDASEVLAELQARRSVLRSQLEVGAASLDAGRAIEVDEQDLDRYLSKLAPPRIANEDSIVLATNRSTETGPSIAFA